VERKVRAAIWGAGWVTTGHLDGWINNKRSTLVAMGSRRGEQVVERLREAGREGTVDVYDSLEEMLKRGDFNAISICLPPHAQADAAMMAAESGRHILVEKPIAKTLPELRKLLGVVRSTGVKAMAGFVLRWNPMVQMARRMVTQGWLGKIVYARLAYLHELSDWYSGWGWARTREQGGTVTLLGGCHAVDTARYLVNQEAVEVAAFSTRGHRQDFEYEPTIAALVRFNDGAIAHIAASQELHMPYQFPIELMGSKGALRDGRLWSDSLAGQTDWVGIPTEMPDSGQVSHHPFRSEISNFVDGILDGAELLSPLEDAAKSHEIVFAMDESAAGGGKVVHLPLKQ
jgi:predicted dehydrogenase